MKTRKIMLLTGLFMLLLAPAVLAGDMITVTNTVKIDGKIGLYIRNDVGMLMHTNPSAYNKTVLRYTVNGTNVSIVANKSVDSLPNEIEKLVVLDKAWPSKGYYAIDITYVDSGGYEYDEDTFHVFAKPGISRLDAYTDPGMVVPNASFTLRLKVKASDEDSIADINAVMLENPKYFRLDTKRISNSLAKGEEAEFDFTFKVSGQSMPETIVYETLSIPIRISYTYLGKSSSNLINESIIVYSKAQTAKLPVMDAVISVPPTVERGTSADVPIYLWNSKIGSKSACSVNLTLTSGSGITIPVSNILPSDKTFAPTDLQPSEAAAIFKIGTSESTPVGTYTLTLDANYKDCKWKSPGSMEKQATFEVVEPAPEPEPEPVVNESVPETVTVETPSVESNVSIEEPAKEESIAGPANETVEDSQEQSSFIFYLGLGTLLAIMIFLVVYLLETKSRYI